MATSKRNRISDSQRATPEGFYDRGMVGTGGGDYRVYMTLSNYDFNNIACNVNKLMFSNLAANCKFVYLEIYYISILLYKSHLVL